MNAHEFISMIDEAAVLEAVKSAERRTSGEVRIFVSRRRLRGREAKHRALREFRRLDMDCTQERNAVLFYLVPSDRAFAVISDEAVHAKCGQPFWDETAKAMEAEFALGHFTEGLVAGIRRAADLLEEHFPRSSRDRNELPDAIAGD